MEAISIGKDKTVTGEFDINGSKEQLTMTYEGLSLRDAGQDSAGHKVIIGYRLTFESNGIASEIFEGTGIHISDDEYALYTNLLANGGLDEKDFIVNTLGIDMPLYFTDDTGNVISLSETTRIGTEYSVPETASERTGIKDANGKLLKAVTKEMIEANEPIFTAEEAVNVTTIEWPEGVTKIGENVFKGCANLTEVTIPNTITSIGESAFEGCGLTSIVIPDGVTTIEENTFKDCPLTEITLPDSVEEIKPGLPNCTVNSSTDYWIDGDTVLLKDELSQVTGTATKGILESIELKTAPTKTSYLAGESFDTTGAVITANFKNSGSRDITLVEATDSVLKVTDTSVNLSVTVNGITKSVEQPITVERNANPISLSAASGSTCIGKTLAFTVNNPSGGAITATSNNANATVTVNSNTITVTPKAACTATITVTSTQTDNYLSGSVTYTATFADHTAVTGGSLRTSATCTAAATYYHKCSVCGKNLTTYYSSGAKKAHSYTVKSATSTYLRSNATCTAAATYYYKCSGCSAKGSSYYSYGSALGHAWSWGTWSGNTDNWGYGITMSRYYCTRCHAIESSDYGGTGYGQWTICSCAQSGFHWDCQQSSYTPGQGAVFHAWCAYCGASDYKRLY